MKALILKNNGISFYSIRNFSVFTCSKLFVITSRFNVMNTLKTQFLFDLMAFAAADSYYNLQVLDFSALEANHVEFKKYKDCILNKGPCNALYGSYKAHLPEGVIQACRRCTVVQKHFGYQLFETLKTKYPEDYALFKQIYDPRNKYLEAMEKELDKYKTI